MGRGEDPAALTAAYEKALSRQGWALPGAAEALERWRRRVRVIIVTNGVAAVQHGRFAASPFPWMERELLISQEVGAAKPDPRMIRLAMERSGVIVTPGASFGPHGEGYVRMALVLPPEGLREAVAAIAAAGM